MERTLPFVIGIQYAHESVDIEKLGLFPFPFELLCPIGRLYVLNDQSEDTALMLKGHVSTLSFYR